MGVGEFCGVYECVIGWCFVCLEFVCCVVVVGVCWLGCYWVRFGVWGIGDFCVVV